MDLCSSHHAPEPTAPPGRPRQPVSQWLEAASSNRTNPFYASDGNPPPNREHSRAFPYEAPMAIVYAFPTVSGRRNSADKGRTIWGISGSAYTAGLSHRTVPRYTRTPIDHHSRTFLFDSHNWFTSECLAVCSCLPLRIRPGVKPLHPYVWHPAWIGTSFAAVGPLSGRS